MSIINFKKYDKIFIQTYVRLCSAQIVQIRLCRTNVLSSKSRKNGEIPTFYVYRGY
nr:MAG TPA: hypothetical protein [Bacteriophage sp.]